MRWIEKERVACYAGEQVTVKSMADQSVLFTGVIKGLKFTFHFCPDNIKTNNTVACNLPGLAQCRYYPFHILGSPPEICNYQFDNITEDEKSGIQETDLSQQKFSFEKTNGEVLFTAKLQKCMPNDWYGTYTGGRRRKPPYDLLPKEKMQGLTSLSASSSKAPRS